MALKYQQVIVWAGQPKRRGWLVLVIILIFAVPSLYFINQKIQREASDATAAANRKQAQAQTLVNIAFAKKQKSDELDSWMKSIGACNRNNVLRARIEASTQGLGYLEQALATSRLAAAKLESDPALAAHDRAQAAKYVKLKANLKTTPQIQCILKYPYPFPGEEHK